MGARGSKPKPTALKVLEGNPGKRKLNENEPKPEEASTLNPPSHLSSIAKKEWKKLAKSLSALGVFTAVDGTVFELYCETYARWREAMTHIREQGSTFETPSGYQQQTPWVSIAQQSAKQLQSLAAEFGMTPASRSRISTTGNSAQSVEDDPMEALLGGKW